MNDEQDSIAALTLATSTARAVLVSASDVSDPRNYPFAHVTGRDQEAEGLRKWLLGGRTNYDKDRRPLGGAALVTGFRGVGKSTLVNKVLFDVSLAGLYGINFADNPTWGPFAQDTLAKRVKAAESGKAPQAGHVPRLYVPVHIDVANAIERRDLMERVLRRTYFALSRYQIGALRPDLMRRARLAYIRTLGKLEATATAKVNEKLTTTLGATLEGLSKLEVTAQQEMEFAETLKLIAEDLSIEEMEDELIDLGGELSEGVHGVEDAAGRRLLTAITRARDDGYLRLRHLFQGDVGRQVHIVYVFDELDKLDDGGARKSDPTEVDLYFNLPTAPLRGTIPSARSSGEGKLTVVSPSRSSALASAAGVIRQLKILFSTTGVSAVVIGGAVAEEQWLDEVAERDPLLRSVFSRHVYVPQLALPAVTSMFAGFVLPPESPAAITFWTRGRYKQLLRARGAALSGRLDDEFPHVSHAALAAILGNFGGTDLKHLTPVSPLQALERARDLESIAAALLASAVPITRREVFGADVLRTLLIRVAVDYLDPVMHVDTPPPDREARIRERLTEFLPPLLHDTVMQVVRRTVVWALAQQSKPPVLSSPS